MPSGKESYLTAEINSSRQNNPDSKSFSDERLTDINDISMVFKDPNLKSTPPMSVPSLAFLDEGIDEDSELLRRRHPSHSKYIHVLALMLYRIQGATSLTCGYFTIYTDSFNMSLYIYES